MSKPNTTSPAGLLAPIFALLLAAGAGAAVYSFETGAATDALSKALAVKLSQGEAIKDAKLGAVRVISREKIGGWSFPRRFVDGEGEALKPADTYLARELLSPREGARLVDADGDGAPDHTVAAAALKDAWDLSKPGAFIVGEAPIEPLPSTPWGLIFIAMLVGFGIWAWLIRAFPGRLCGPLGALVSALCIGGAFAYAGGAANQIIQAALPGGPVAVSATLPIAALLIPLVLYAVLGWYTESRLSPNRTAFTYIAPAMVGMSVLILVPFAFGFGLAFFRFDGNTSEFVGLDHFIKILFSSGYALNHPLSFYYTLFVTVMWTALNVFLHAAIGLGIALILREPTLKFKGVYRVLLIVPWAVPNYITALIWRGMFNAEYGLINHGLEAMGLEKIQWFSQPMTAFIANLTTNTWLGFPFMMVVALGALQSIPRDLYEAADVDGADEWQKFKLITLPLLRPALLPAIILGSVWTFNMFNIIYLVSQGRPNNSTDILIVEAYRVAFEQERYGYAAAYSVLIFLMLLLYSRITERVSKAAEEAYG